MIYEKNSVVLDLSWSAKDAALYFDYVIPLYMHTEISKEVIIQILPQYLLDPARDKDVVESYLEVLKSYTIWEFHRLKGILEDTETADVTKKELGEFFEKIKIFKEKYNLVHLPLLLPESDRDTDENKQPSALVTLTKLHLVDANKAPWEQILEFRKDIESTKRLRRLKLFFQQTYAAKDKSFIEDDLLSRIDDYHEIVNKWGFETMISSFSALLSSKSLLGTIGGVIASALFKEPHIAAVTAASGTCIEIGKISLHLSERKYGLVKLRREHPLNYIIAAKETLKSGSVTNL